MKLCQTMYLFVMVLPFVVGQVRESILFNQSQNDFDAMLHLKGCILSEFDYKITDGFGREFIMWYYLSRDNMTDKICLFHNRYRVETCINKRNDVPYVNKVINNSRVMYQPNIPASVVLMCIVILCLLCILLCISSIVFAVLFHYIYSAACAIYFCLYRRCVQK